MPVKSSGLAPGLTNAWPRAAKICKCNGEWAQLELTDALFLTDDEALTIVGNALCVIPENLVFKKTTEKSRREIIQDLLSNDPRNKHEQVWT